MVARMKKEMAIADTTIIDDREKRSRFGSKL